MIIVLKPQIAAEEILKFTDRLQSDYNVGVNRWDGVHSTVLGLIGDTTKVDIEYIDAQEIVESVKRVQEPYKKANRKFHPENTVIKITDSVSVGDGSLHIMAARLHPAPADLRGGLRDLPLHEPLPRRRLPEGVRRGDAWGNCQVPLFPRAMERLPNPFRLLRGDGSRRIPADGRP